MYLDSLYLHKSLPIPSSPPQILIPLRKNCFTTFQTANYSLAGRHLKKDIAGFVSKQLPFLFVDKRNKKNLLVY